jgi:2-hydroxycyclohexanecarboxyl-CoA dehydrogenase
MELKDKVAIVTGAGQGIGRGIALRLAKMGAKIAIADINMETSMKVVEEIESAGSKAIAVETDVANFEAVDRMVKKVLETFGTVDILVNNAGYVSPQPTPFIQENKDYWDRVIDVCYKGVIYCCRAVLDTMMEKKNGRIVSIASEAGRIGQEGQTVYSGAKGAVIAFSKALAREVARYGITVNCVSPGATNTEAFAKAPPEVKEKAPKAYPLRRIAEVDDIANAVAFFCLDSSNYITGQVLSVSGGYTMI